jgi:two-component system, NtrC family, sensor kinase
MKSRKSTVLLTDEEAVLKVLSDQAPVGVSIMQDGKFCYFNSFFSAATGYAVDELAGRDSLEIVVPEDKEIVRENTIRMLKGESLSPYQFRVIRKDGRIAWVLATAKSTRYRGRLAALGNYIDITERKQAEDRLRESEQKYRTILEEMGDGYFETDLAGNVTFVNDAIVLHSGYSREELIGMNYRALRPKGEAKAVFEAYNRVYKTGEPSRNIPTETVSKDGKHVFAETSAFPIRNDEGEIVGFRGIRRDITERKQAEEALKKSEERYRQLAENAGEAIFVVQDGVIKFINPKGAELAGYSIQEMVSRPFVQFIHPDDVGLVADRYARRIKGEAVPQIYEFRIIRKDGDSRWAELNAVTASWENGPAVLCFANDVTERKKTGEALRQSEERYRAMLEKMEDSYSEVDLSGNITFINSAACRHLGYSREELMGMSYKSFTAADHINPMFQIYNAIYRTGVPNKGFRWKIVGKDGGHRLIDASASPMRNDKGEIIGFSTVGRDVTERTKVEEQLIVTDRLASIGQLAAGIAHELNNPLTGVIGFSELLLERDLPADVKADLETVNQEARRAVNIVKGLLAFCHEQRIEKSLVDINSVIQGVLQLRSYEQRVSNIEVFARFAAALPPVLGNGAQLKQVFMNIIVNAEQATLEAHGRGNLAIRTEQAGDVVRASITDDGPGISADNMRQLFQPFFTTRDVGKGTGLGLSICHGIVTEHGGKIHAESEPGKGATFVVELPIYQTVKKETLQ